MDPVPKNQVSGICLRLADRGTGGGIPPKNTSLQLTWDMGGGGGADTQLPSCLHSPQLPV